MARKYGLPDWFFFGFLALISLIFLKVVAWFIIDIVLAIVLTHLFYKFYQYLRSKFNLRPQLAAIICVLISLVLIVIPLVVICILLYKEAAHFYILIRANWAYIQLWWSVEHWANLHLDLPLIGNVTDLLRQIQFEDQVSKIMNGLSHGMLVTFERMFIDFSLGLLHLLVTLILHFFFLMDGDKLIERVQELSPLKAKDEEELFSEMTRMVDATLVGTIIIALIEGLFGGLLFWAFGLPSPLLWGVIMITFSIIPILGIHGVVLPAIIYLFFTGHWIKAIFLFFISHAGTTITQHYVRPTLIGKRGGVHPGIILLSILGGIAWLGVPGFLIGPIIASLFISVWNQFGRHYHLEIDLWGRGKKSPASE